MPLNPKLYRLEVLKGRVTHICDGDTLDLTIKSGWWQTETLRIRLAGINTPELAKQRPQTLQDAVNEPGSIEALNYTEKLLKRRVRVQVARLKGSRGLVRGSMGRVIGNVLPHHNIDLVRHGLARIVKRSACTWMSDRLWKQLIKAEKLAQRKKVGMWKVGSQKQHSSGAFWWCCVGVMFGIFIMFILGG